VQLIVTNQIQGVSGLLISNFFRQRIYTRVLEYSECVSQYINALRLRVNPLYIQEGLKVISSSAVN